MCTLGSIAGSANASIQFKRALFSLRGTVNSESLFDDHFSDIGLLVGLATHGRKGHASAAIGVAMVTGSRNEGLDLFGPDTGREKIDPTFGLPIEV